MSYTAINHLGMLYTYKFVLTCRKLIWQIVLAPVIWEIATVTIRHVLNTTKTYTYSSISLIPSMQKSQYKTISFLIDSDTNMIMLCPKRQRSIITYNVGCCFMVEDVFLGLQVARIVQDLQWAEVTIIQYCWNQVFKLLPLETVHTWQIPQKTVHCKNKLVVLTTEWLP